MPIYEYECKECGKGFAKLLLKRDDPVACPYCDSTKLEKLVSMCATGGGDKQRLDGYEIGQRQSESFHHDSRNLGMWAEKRAKELGIELPRQAQEALDKARSGRVGDILGGKLF